MFLHNIFPYTFTPLMLGGIFPHFKRIQFCPQTDKLLNYLSTRLVYQLLSYLHLFEFTKGD